MDTLQLIFTTLSIIFLALSAYGALKLNRKNFLLGIFLFSLLPVIGEANVYSSTGNWGNLATIMAFLSIAIVTLPSKIKYGADNIAAISIARKIGLAIIFVNLFQGYIIFSARTDVPSQYGLMHIIQAIIVIYPIVKSNSKEGLKWN